ncbi:hypothetical protein [Dehalobacter sp. TeCB1]|uniref:hypothetical protein n=1 Tax=Dehalobacter sp. TeCB1 TaxID=1843715 RepID=UPI00083A1F8F|nr:hypothetical protein [Dehalobacter sp. TeCB1]OCZ50856.1 hypothetical protein A7D23_14255 [Dehalobacter sp. TeCB1]
MNALKECKAWKIGEKCKIKEWAGIYEIGCFHQYGQGENSFVKVNVYKLKKDGSRNGMNTSVDIGLLLPLDAKQPSIDNNGLSAQEYAKQAFSCGFAKSDFFRTTSESIVKIVSISNTGRVKVQGLTIKKGIQARSKKIDKVKIYSQEDYIVNFANLEYFLDGNEMTFSPRLHDGKWNFSHSCQYLKPVDMKLTRLLD